MTAQHDTQQLLRLRTLRVQKARDHCTRAQEAIDQAALAVQSRQREIEQIQQRIHALKHTVAHALAPQLPRWADVAAAQREQLDDRLERAEYALIDDEHHLEAAEQALRQARAELGRALSREDAVRNLAQEQRRTTALAQEQRTELEVEDTHCTRRFA